MRRPTTGLLLLLAVGVVTLNSQAVFLVGAGFFQIGPELGIGPVGLGVLTATFFLAAAITSAPLGRWVARVGWQRAMRINLRAASLLLLAIPVLVHDAWTLGALLAVGAAVYGSANPAANQALADHTNPERQATIFGAKHAGIPSSTLLAGLAVPLVVENWGWRWSFAIASLLAFAVSFTVPDGELAEPIQTPERPTRKAPPTTSMRDLFLLAIGSSFATWGAIALGTYLVSASVDVGLTASQAGTLQFVGSAASIAARIGVGLLTDRRGGNGFAGIVTLAAIGAVVFFVLPASMGLVYVVLVVAAFSTGWAWPGLMTFAVVNANRGSVAASSSITQAGIFIGAGGVPIILGLVIERWSYDGAWVVAGCGLVVAAVVVGLVSRRLVVRPDPSR